jgi:hypothetical protein
MKTPSDGFQMPEEMVQKLIQVRQQDRRTRFQAGLLRAIAILLAAMLAAMAIDWLMVLRLPLWRWTLTLAALAAVAVGFVQGCLLPLLRRRSLDSLAGDVDRAHPFLEERFLTLAGFAHDQDSSGLSGSSAMLRKVSEQTAGMSGAVAIAPVVSRSGLNRSWNYFWIALGALVLVFAVDFPRAKILCERFWAPGADLSLTQLQAKTGDLVIGKGEAVKLEITASGRKTDSATLSIRSAKGRNETVALQRAAAPGTEFVYNQDAVLDSFEYRARSGDGQTAWHRVTVLDRPKLSQVQLRIVPPAYSRLPVVEEKALPHQVRALEGSRLDVSFQADQPLAKMELRFSDGGTQPLTETPDHAYHFTALLTNTIAFQPLLDSARHMDNLDKPSCEIVVYPDEPPTVTVVTPSDEITAHADEKVKIEFEARDDIGLASAELVVTVKNDDGSNAAPVVIPIPLDEAKEKGAKLVRKQVELDLAQFNLKQDQQLSYVVRVTDTKASPASAAPSSAADERPSGSLADSQKTNNPNAANRPPTDSAQPDQKQNALMAQNNPSTLALKASQNQNQNPNASQPPPNDMAKRALDAGQCSSCQPMNIKVDEWAGSFEGQQRQKQEIAIDPVLKQLDELLGKAQDQTDATLAAGRLPAGLGPTQSEPMETVKDDLRQADRAVTDLRGKCEGTPYAFVSLQIQDVRDTHLTPARQDLGNVTLETAKLKADLDNLEQASFQIKSARLRLADLTKSYESVKRDYKLADAMQHLQKMHQLFIEDTQALLGSKKPVLNPQDRKVAEVSDEFADKMKKLLEEQKTIMAELAKILADDPRMLRRFLALEQLEGTSLRDQMTLLNRRQQAQQQQVAQWAGATEAERAPLVAGYLASQSAEQIEVSALATKMQENMVTWWPTNLPVDLEPITACRNLAADVARLSAEAAGQTNLDAGLVSGRKAMDQLRALHERLPDLENTGDGLAMFVANRMDETGTLITRQSGWIKKIEALRAGDFPQAAEVDQHQLTVDSTGFSEKLDAASAAYKGMSELIGAQADQLILTVRDGVLPEQSDAGAALAKKSLKTAANHQAEATNAFNNAEAQFDGLLHAIIAKLDAAPPPSDPGQAKTLEDLLAMLENEKRAAEGLGIPCRPINVAVMKDWLKSGSNPGQGQGRAQALAAQQQARTASDRMQRTGNRARTEARVRSAKASETAATGPEAGPKHPASSWNTVVSQLGDEIRQGRDSVPPEQYRQAIEQYFNTISETLPVTPAPSGQGDH